MHTPQHTRVHSLYICLGSSCVTSAVTGNNNNNKKKNKRAEDFLYKISKINLSTVTKRKKQLNGYNFSKYTRNI